MPQQKSFICLFFSLSVLFQHSAVSQNEQERRKHYLDELIRLQEQPASHDSFVNYHDSTWVAWVERTGELPPDFDAVPSIPFLPDPLIIDEGGKNIAVKSWEQWESQRTYFKEKVKELFSGTFPAPPDNMTSKILEERTENGVKIQMVVLRFGEDHKAKLTLEIITPPGDGPFPVFMTQWNHRGWAQIAVRRGYMGVVYAGADAKDDTREYLEFYPQHDWTTLMTRAWGAHRAVDYLYTLDHVNKSQIALTGHSRNAKQSLFAAAFDNRITAVISSSGGTGGEFPYRYTDERHANESIDYLVSRRTHWLHPRLRFYMGREHKMPIDQNSLMALLAPNALLLSSSIREGGGGDPWAIEQLYHSLEKVYAFHHASDKLGIRFRDGVHAVSARDLEAFMDWLDIQFDRKDLPWENRLVYNYNFEEWKTKSNEKFEIAAFPDRSGPLIAKTDWKSEREQIREKTKWLLGVEPPGISASKIEGLGSNQDYVSSFINRPRVTHGKMRTIAPYNAIGDYLYGSLYYPTAAEDKPRTNSSGKMPVVIFLHKYANTGFDVSLSRLFDSILSKGIAVLSMDLIGYGARIEEGSLFYQRYPRWSKMGKMVTDTRAAVDALEDIEFIDKDKIFIAGYAMGGTVALFTAAMEPKIAGIGVSSAFTPLREASSDVEGLKAFSHLYGLIPRLGFFYGREKKIPVDFKEILSAIAPKPLLVISPDLDRHTNHGQILREMGEVQQVFDTLGAANELQFETPHGFNHFTTAQEKILVEWLEKVATSQRNGITSTNN